SSGLQAMPFLTSPASASAGATFFPDSVVQRTLGPCTDQWNVQNGALYWTNYTRAWSLPSLTDAKPIDKQHFFLPATWMVFTIKNTTSQAEDFYFGLPVQGSQKEFSHGSYQGFAVGEAV